MPMMSEKDSAALKSPAVCRQCLQYERACSKEFPTCKMYKDSGDKCSYLPAAWMDEALEKAACEDGGEGEVAGAKGVDRQMSEGKKGKEVTEIAQLPNGAKTAKSTETKAVQSKVAPRGMMTSSKKGQAEVAVQETSGSGASSETPLKSKTKCRQCFNNHPVLGCSKDVPTCIQCGEFGRACSYIRYVWMETASFQAKNDAEKGVVDANEGEISVSSATSDVAKQSQGQSKAKSVLSKSFSPPATMSSLKSTRKCKRCLYTKTADGGRLACSKDLPVCNECEEIHKKCVYPAYGTKGNAKEEEDDERDQEEEQGKGKEKAGRSKASGAKKSTPSVEPETHKSSRKCRHCTSKKSALNCSKDLPTCDQCEKAGKECNYTPYGSQTSPKKNTVSTTRAKGKKTGGQKAAVEEDDDIESGEEEEESEEQVGE